MHLSYGAQEEWPPSLYHRRLVAISRVPEADALQNMLLGLPTEALSVLNVQLHFEFA